MKLAMRPGRTNPGRNLCIIAPSNTTARGVELTAE